MTLSAIEMDFVVMKAIGKCFPSRRRRSISDFCLYTSTESAQKLMASVWNETDLSQFYEVIKYLCSYGVFAKDTMTDTNAATKVRCHQKANTSFIQVPVAVYEGPL